MAGTGSRNATKQARQQVVAARQGVATELDALGTSARSAFDIPGKVRSRPIQTLGMAGGAAFLALGGPKRVAKRVRTALNGGTPPPPRGLLPKDIERTVDGLGSDAPAVKATLEREFARYLNDKRRGGELEPNGQQSLWRLFDIISVPLGAATAKKLTERLLAADADRVAGEPTSRGVRAPSDAEARGSADPDLRAR